jgi:hypothetical protein
MLTGLKIVLKIAAALAFLVLACSFAWLCGLATIALLYPDPPLPSVNSRANMIGWTVWMTIFATIAFFTIRTTFRSITKDA